MTYDFEGLKTKIKDAENWLIKEFQGIRTGRATPAILDGVQAESYGTRVSLNQIANIGVEDARSLRVSPWDPSQVKEIEKAISNANLGVGVSSDESGVRVTFPELTSERREQLIKLAHDKFEHAKISIRQARDDAWGDIQKKEKAGEVGEDDKFRAKDEMQKMVDDGNKALEELTSKKESEIKT